MKKALLSTILLTATGMSLNAQELAANKFFFLDNNYIVATGAIPGSMLDFHAETGGGKRLLQLVADTGGKAMYLSHSPVRARMAANVTNEQTGTPGSQKVAYIGQLSFSVQHLQLGQSDQLHSLSCDMEAAQEAAFKLVLMRKLQDEVAYSTVSEEVIPGHVKRFDWTEPSESPIAEYKLAVYSIDGQPIVNSAPFSFSPAQQMHLYPNPAAQWVKVSKSNLLRQYDHWSILNLNEQVVKSGSNPQDLATNGVPITELPAGTYLLRLTGKGVPQHSLSFVKQ